MHLLWINLVTDCFPALALGMEKAERDIMRRQPRDAKAGVFAGGMGVDIAYQGILVSLLTLASYFVGHFMESGVWEIANSADGTDDGLPHHEHGGDLPQLQHALSARQPLHLCTA